MAAGPSDVEDIVIVYEGPPRRAAAGIDAVFQINADGSMSLMLDFSSCLRCRNMAFSKCPRCRNAYYCSEICRLLDWYRHKHNCRPPRQ